jgi:hypothetical protein
MPTVYVRLLNVTCTQLPAQRSFIAKHICTCYILNSPANIEAAGQALSPTCTIIMQPGHKSVSACAMERATGKRGRWQYSHQRNGHISCAKNAQKNTKKVMCLSSPDIVCMHVYVTPWWPSLGQLGMQRTIQAAGTDKATLGCCMRKAG